MALVPPRLDDRTFADLSAELKRRIPVHAPEWTDHNASDPGIALVELFAALGDDLLYRLNRVPEAARLEFLRLLGVLPRPAGVARAQVRIDLPPRAYVPVTPDFAGGGSPRLLVAAGELHFQALGEVTALPVELGAWTKQAYLGDVLGGGEANLQTLLQDHLGSAPALDRYQAIPLPAPKGGVLPPGVSTASTLDGRVWLALLAPESVLKGATLEQVRLAIAGHCLNLGVRTDDRLCGPSDLRRCPAPGTDPPRWPVRWEVSTGRFTGAARTIDRVLYRRLTVVEDGTEGLTRSGVLRLRLPDRQADGSVPFGDWTADSFDPPDPDLLGIGALPPRLDDDKQAARVLCWVRLGRVDPSHPPIELRSIDANMVEVEQAVTAAPELLGYGDGRPGKRVRLSRTPVIRDSERIQVLGTLGWENWIRVDDLALAGPDDPFYWLDPAHGTVLFGDGVQGRIPLPGEAIRVQTYRYGGGVRGNLGAGRINKVDSASPPAALGLKATNPLPAEGGTDPEPDEAAAARIPQVLRHNGRAVCMQDFVDLALETPGRPLGRAHCLPRHKPQERVDGVPGCVTLIVLPAYDPLHPDQPTPDREMLRQVCHHLEPRRLVTTELYVTPPEYARLSASIAVEPDPGAGEETLRRHVELALRQHLAPLPPYGPDGSGWPFGRDVRDRDLEAAALRVLGVRLVNQVLLVGEAIDRTGTRSPVTGTLPLLPWQLPVLLEVQVAIGPGVAADPLPPLDTEPPPSPVSSMPVPVAQESC